MTQGWYSDSGLPGSRLYLLTGNFLTVLVLGWCQCCFHMPDHLELHRSESNVHTCVPVRVCSCMTPSSWEVPNLLVVYPAPRSETCRLSVGEAVPKTSEAVQAPRGPDWGKEALLLGAELGV